MTCGLLPILKVSMCNPIWYYGGPLLLTLSFWADRAHLILVSLFNTRHLSGWWYDPGFSQIFHVSNLRFLVGGAEGGMEGQRTSLQCGIGLDKAVIERMEMEMETETEMKAVVVWWDCHRSDRDEGYGAWWGRVSSGDERLCWSPSVKYWNWWLIK